MHQYKTYNHVPITEVLTFDQEPKEKASTHTPLSVPVIQ